MTFVVEHLDAKVRQIVPREIDPGLVPIQQPDGAIPPDPDIRRPRITVDDGQRHVDQALEHGKHLVCDVGRYSIEVGIDAGAERSKLAHVHAAWSLIVTFGFAM